MFMLALTVLVIMGSVAFDHKEFSPAPIVAATLLVGSILTIIFSIMAMVINAF